LKGAIEGFLGQFGEASAALSFAIGLTENSKLYEGAIAHLRENLVYCGIYFLKNVT
jgi:hypothetical protein